MKKYIITYKKINSHLREEEIVLANIMQYNDLAWSTYAFILKNYINFEPLSKEEFFEISLYLTYDEPGINEDRQKYACTTLQEIKICGGIPKYLKGYLHENN